jgi:CubicO group peptidase (beta-lactamase class C family)
MDAHVAPAQVAQPPKRATREGGARRLRIVRNVGRLAHFWMFLSAFGCGGSSAPAPPAPPASELDAFIQDAMTQMKVPGLSALVVKHGGIAWQKGYGWADVESRAPVGPDTVFQVASISKTIVAVAVMQSVEDGRLDLDGDVDRGLDFPVRNPAAPQTPITLRQVMTHTSSLNDNPTLFLSLVRSVMPLGGFLRDYLVPGARYASADSYYAGAPGTAFNYANVNGALAGYVVEAAEGEPFDRLTERRIFAPLGMTQTSWAPGPVPGATNATPYVDFGRIAPDEYPFLYPEGGLRTSAPQLARFLLMFMQDGSYGGARIVSAASVAEMRRVSFPALAPNQGLFWVYQPPYLGHSGGVNGITSLMYFRPADAVGVIVLMNGSLDRDPARQATAGAVVGRLFAEADRL